MAGIKLLFFTVFMSGVVMGLMIAFGSVALATYLSRRSTLDDKETKK